MISQRDRLLTQLLGTITREADNKTAFRINISNAVNILSTHGYNLASKSFESLLEEVLNRRLVGSALEANTPYKIAVILLDIAGKCHIPDETIVEYVLKHKDPEEAVKLHEKVKSWRKEYYGSMDESKRRALLEALSDRMRPDVLDQIRNA